MKKTVSNKYEQIHGRLKKKFIKRTKFGSKCQTKP